MLVLDGRLYKVPFKIVEIEERFRFSATENNYIVRIRYPQGKVGRTEFRVQGTDEMDVFRRVAMSPDYASSEFDK